MSGPAASAPRLHIPDEPVAARQAWRDRVLEGEAIENVVAGPHGVADWFWGRWRVLAATGMGEKDLTAVVDGYRREVWLWLIGDRTWVQCCSGLIGRIERRTGA